MGNSTGNSIPHRKKVLPGLIQLMAKGRLLMPIQEQRLACRKENSTEYGDRIINTWRGSTMNKHEKRAIKSYGKIAYNYDASFEGNIQIIIAIKNSFENSLKNR